MSNSGKIRSLASIVVFSVVLLAASFLLWSTDRITMQGERTIYTVICSKGQWVDDKCSGDAGTGPRYRFRALRAHNEVLFWVVGSTEPSSKLTNCKIQDGRNWLCPVTKDADKSITLEMVKGTPTTNAEWPTLPFHAVSKVSWYLVDLGFRLGV